MWVCGVGMACPEYVGTSPWLSRASLDTIRRDGHGAARLRGGLARMHNLSMFDWSDVRYFLAVAREGSSLAAARVLRVNQSTVYRRLGELEKRLGCPLVERHPTGYRLTDYGKELQPYAERIEAAASALQRHAATFDKGMSGTVRLTCSTAVAHRLMRSELIDAFHKQYPGIKVELLMTERVLDLSKGEADVAIRGGEAREEALVGKRIGDVLGGLREPLLCGAQRHPGNAAEH